jgi:hypothetical protein
MAVDRTAIFAAPGMCGPRVSGGLIARSIVSPKEGDRAAAQLL